MPSGVPETSRRLTGTSTVGPLSAVTVPTVITSCAAARPAGRTLERIKRTTRENRLRREVIGVPGNERLETHAKGNDGERGREQDHGPRGQSRDGRGGGRGGHRDRAGDQ